MYLRETQRAPNNIMLISGLVACLNSQTGAMPEYKFNAEGMLAFTIVTN